MTVNNATSATAVISIDPAAAVGNRAVTLTTNPEVASSASNAFQVVAGVPSATLNPNFGVQGNNPTIAINGAFTNFTSGVTAVSFGNGISTGTVTVNGPTQASVPIQIGAGATLGTRNVTITTGSQQAQATFTVTAGQPTITSITPNSGVPGAANLTVTIAANFTNWVNQTTVVSFGPGISVGGGTVGQPGPVTVNNAGNLTASITIQAGATLGTRNVVVTTGAEQETAGNGFTVLSCSTTPPTWISNSPASNASNVPLNTIVQIEFNAPIDRTTVNTNDIILYDTTLGKDVPITVSVDASGRIITLTPSQLLAVGREYYAEWGDLDGTHIAKDTCGNALTTQALYFTTSFSAETAGPSLIAHSPISGDTNDAENTNVVLQFSQPINPITQPSGLTVSTGGTVVPGTYTFSPDYTEITYVPGSTLQANTTYTVTYTAALLDGAGNGLTNPGSFTFTTNSATDTVNGSVTATDPVNQATGIGTNVTPTVYFSKIIDPITLTTTNFYLYDAQTGLRIPAAVSVAANRLSATLTPANPLQPNTYYYFQVAGANYYDLAGNYMYGVTSYFYTCSAAVTSLPAVASISPPNGASGTPINTQVVAVMSALINAETVGPNAITVTAGNATVAGAVTLSNTDYRTLTFVPASNLAASTTYTVTVSGFQDQDGNAVSPSTTTFTTGAASSTGSFGATSVSPANGATGVSNAAQVVITFSRVINPASANNILVRDQSNSYYNIAGTWAVNGATATFTPTSPYPANAVIQVWTQDEVQDLAGNTDNAYVVATFTVGSAADTTAPTVTSITPPSGATGVGRNATIAITFSKSVNPASVQQANAVQLFNGDTNLGTSGITFSANNRTITFTTTAPAAQTITIVLTSLITDLSGNSLQPFQSQYTTAADIPGTAPAVIAMRPANGATDISQNAVITLFTSGSPLNPSTVQGALYVSQNGVLIEGTTTLAGNNQAIQFTPSGPLTYGALIQVNLIPAVQDIYGNALQNFSGQFTVQGNPATVAPQLISENPMEAAMGVPLNVIPQFEFDQALLASSVSSASVRLLDGCTNEAVAGTVSLTGSGNNVIQFRPSSPLTSLCNGSANYYYLQMNDFGGPNVTNTGGIAAPAESYYFYVGTAANNTAPAVLSIAPPNGATGVGVNGVVIVTFSAPVNPISVTGATILVTGASQTVIPASIGFNGTDTVVTITPQAPLPASAQMTVSINGVTDPEGNAVTPASSSFTTGAGPDFTQPAVTSTSPSANQTGVPTNAVIVIHFSKQIAAATINSTTFYLYDTVANQYVPASISLSSDLMTATLVPNSPLAIDRSYYFYWSNGIMDLTGNSLTGGDAYFTTASATSSTVPQVTAVNPANGLSSIPTNAVVQVSFNEPIQPTSLAQVTISTGGHAIIATPALDSSDQLLSITPGALLQPSTQFTVSVAGVMDFTGHTIASAFTSTFTTGPSSDITNGDVVATDPVYQATGVGTNVTPKVYFSRKIDPLTFTASNFYLVNAYSGRTVPATVTVSVDQLSATLTPAQPLQPNTYYYFQVAGSYYDIAGNYMSGGTWYFYTGSGPVTTGANVSSISPPNGTAGAPVNTQVIAVMSAPINSQTVGPNAITVTAGGTAVAGAVALSTTDYETLKFVPIANLATSTKYTVTVGGFQDQDGNTVATSTTTFTTGASSTAAAPGSLTLVSVTPPNTNPMTVLTNNTMPVVITFSEIVNPATVNNILVRDESNGYALIAGTWTVNPGNGAQVTFTPASPYPPNATIQVWTQDEVQDLAGNTDNAYVVTTFIAANVADTTAPAVTSVTPANGATGVGTSPTVVLTFSKSLNPSTVNSTNVQVFSGDTSLSVNPAFSADNRTVSFQLNNLPGNQVITVAATPGVQDLSGNSLTAFQSQFTTGPVIPSQGNGPSVVTQRPAYGATDVPQNAVITLFTSGSALNASTVQGALHVSQNGTAITGSTQVVGAGAIEFTPSSNFAYGALIQVFLDKTVQDANGNPLTSAYSGEFTVQGNPATVAPQLISENPMEAAMGVPLNVIPQFEFDQALLASSVSSTSVHLLDGCTDQAVAGTVSLTGSGNNVIQFQPQNPLTSLFNGSADYYYLQMNDFGGTNVTNTDGVAAPAESYYFYVGAASNTTAPTVVAVGPPSGATGVGVNASIFVRFSNPVDRISVNGSTIQISGGSQTEVPSSITFDSTGTLVTITPQAPLPVNTQMTIKINGVTDSEGNAVPTGTSTFTTGSGPVTTTPSVVAVSPAANDTIPTNTGAFTIEFNVPLDPLSVTAATMYVYDQTLSQNVAGTITASADAKTYTFSPSGSLTAGDSVYLEICDAWDQVGNSTSCLSWHFTIGTGPDSTAPTVVEVNPLANLTNVPTNAPVQIEFSKEISDTSLASVQLLQNGTPVPVTTATTSANTVVVLTPTALLSPNTKYTISVSGVLDVQGTPMTTAFTSTFTTGGGANLTSPAVVSVTPANGTINVPDNSSVTIVFSNAMDPLSFDASLGAVQLELANTSVVVPSTFSVSVNGTAITFTPNSPFVSGTEYKLVVYYPVTDVAGNLFNGYTYTSTFTAK